MSLENMASELDLDLISELSSLESTSTFTGFSSQAESSSGTENECLPYDGNNYGFVPVDLKSFSQQLTNWNNITYYSADYNNNYNYLVPESLAYTVPTTNGTYYTYSYAYDYTGQYASQITSTSSVMPANSFYQKATDSLYSGNSSDTTDASHVSAMSPNQMDLKLMQKRERNRVAARKCRDKKLNQIKEYENKIQVLQTEIHFFEEDIAKLTNRKNQLRLMLINFFANRLAMNGIEQQ